TNEAQAVRALGAILDNAAKFTTEGSVRLTVKPEGAQMKFIVEDTGSGIPAEDAEKVFEPFTKLNSYFDGAGVGLTAARSIARRLNGDIILDTTFEGPGARFVMTLPF
ncbi:MAG: ATP-binding protein, partial [Prevotella sp.]|nr:ATP-binding protein [Prevotella sp.]